MPHEPITVANEVGRLLDLLEADMTAEHWERIASQARRSHAAEETCGAIGQEASGEVAEAVVA
jgi:hypothetical protein